jgi:hypothetical protein
LCVQLDKRQVKVGEPVLLRVEIRNVTKQELMLGEATPEVENRATITNRNGGIVKPTAKGKRLISRGDWCCNPLKIMVGPGQVHSEALAIDKLFEVSATDTYSITVRRFVGKLDKSGVADLRSNTVTLKVTNQSSARPQGSLWATFMLLITTHSLRTAPRLATSS